MAQEIKRPDFDEDASQGILAGDPPIQLPWLPPMLCQSRDEPFDDPAWIFEPKLDGERCLVYLQSGSSFLFSRNRIDRLDNFPEIQKELQKLGQIRAVLDGEIIVRERGIPSFQALSLRTHLKDNLLIQYRSKILPAELLCFDLLWLGELDLRAAPLEMRKEALGELLEDGTIVKALPYKLQFGKRAYVEAAEAGEEGIIAKRLGTAYSGTRSPHWLKIKSVEEREFVIVGYTPGEGKRSPLFGALLLGAYDEQGDLQFVGKVGSGLSDFWLDHLHPQLEKLRAINRVHGIVISLTSRANGLISTVRPDLVCQVRFQGWTSSGKLRFPRFIGLRDDLDPREVKL